MRPLSDGVFWSENGSLIQDMRIEDLVLLAQAEAPGRWVNVGEATRVAVQGRISKETTALAGEAMRSKHVKRMLSHIPRGRYKQDKDDIEHAIQVAVFSALEQPTTGPGQLIGHRFGLAILRCVYNAVYQHMRGQYGLRTVDRARGETDPSTGRNPVRPQRRILTDIHGEDVEDLLLTRKSPYATAEDTEFAVDLSRARSKAMNPKHRAAAEYLLGKFSLEGKFGFETVREDLGIDPRTAMSRFRKSTFGLLLEDELARMDGSGQGGRSASLGGNADRPGDEVGEGGAGSPPAEVAE